MISPPGDWVAIAVLGRTRGNKGEVTAVALSDKPERYRALHEVFLFGEGFEGTRYEVEDVWFHDGKLILKFRGVDTISDAEPLAGAEVRIPYTQRLELEPGEFYQSDLVGCEVLERVTGESLGCVTEWRDAGGAGLLVLENDVMIPFARSICVDIDPAARRIVVDLPEGLKDLNRT